MLTILFIMHLLINPPTGLEELRKNYRQAMSDKMLCEQLFKRIQSEKWENNPVLLAYQGGIYMGMAKHSAVIAKKTEYIKAGKEKIEKAVRTEPKNVEIRFIRYTIQTHLPPAAGYNKNIAEDRSFIQSHIGEIRNENQRKEMEDYLKDMEKH